MRKALIFIMIGIFLSVLPGCESYFTWRKYADKDKKFSVFIPRSWHIEEAGPEAALSVIIPTVNPAEPFTSSVRMVVEDLPNEVPLSVYYDINREEFRYVFKKMKDVTEGQGMNRLFRHQWIAFNSQIGDSIIIRAISCVWINKKRVYVLTCVMGLSSANEIEPLFRKMIASVRIL